MTLLSHTDHGLHIRAPSLSVLSERKNEGQYSSSAFSFFSSYLKKKTPKKTRQEFEISGLMLEAAIGSRGAYLHANEATQPCCL